MIPVFVERVPGPWWHKRWRVTVELVSLGHGEAVTFWHWTNAGADRHGRRVWRTESARTPA